MASADRVLIVDDDPDMCFLLESTLQQAGFQTATAQNGRQALDALSQERFDLVLTDMKMSGGDGSTLLSDIWRLHPQVGTALITGYRSDDLDAKLNDRRLLAYFEKPIYDLRQVADTLASVLAEHRRRLSRAES